MYRYGLVLLLLLVGGCSFFEDLLLDEPPDAQPDLQFYVVHSQAEPERAGACAGAQLQVTARIIDWAAARQRGDIAGYASFYVPGYSRRHGETHAQWMASLRKTFGNPQPTKVEVDDIHVDCREEQASAKFRLSYSSARRSAQPEAKALVFVRDHEQWYIVKETNEQKGLPNHD